MSSVPWFRSWDWVWDQSVRGLLHYFSVYKPQPISDPRARAQVCLANETPIEMMSGKEKTRENRVRQALHRQGYRLVKTARRDTLARDYGQYSIVDEAGSTVAGWPIRPFSLDDAQAWAGGQREGEEGE